MTGYYLLSGACASCATTVASGTTATTPGGIAGCATCTATAVSAVASTAPFFVTCTSCLATYAFITTGAPTGTSTILIPTCSPYTTSPITLIATTGNTYDGTCVFDTNGQWL